MYAPTGENVCKVPQKFAIDKPYLYVLFHLLEVIIYIASYKQADVYILNVP